MSRSYEFVVGGERLAVSSTYWEALVGPKPPRMWECDGCSNSPDAYIVAPWKVYKLWPACVIHDWAYRTGCLGGTWQARWLADNNFRENMMTQLRLQGAGRIRQNQLAWMYWGRVRIWGASSYREWDEGEKPLSRWRRFREVYGLFRAKR